MRYVWGPDDSSVVRRGSRYLERIEVCPRSSVGCWTSVSDRYGLGPSLTHVTLPKSHVLALDWRGLRLFPRLTNPTRCQVLAGSWVLHLVSGSCWMAVLRLTSGSCWMSRAESFLSFGCVRFLLDLGCVVHGVRFLLDLGRLVPNVRFLLDVLSRVVPVVTGASGSCWILETSPCVVLISSTFCGTRLSSDLGHISHGARPLKCLGIVRCIGCSVHPEQPISL